MPAKSIKQQKFFGLLLAYRRGEIPASKVSAYGRKVAKSMTLKQIEEMAKTKRSDLPGKVKKRRLSDKQKTNDVCNGDTIEFTEAVFAGSYKSPKFLGNRTNIAKIIKESYGQDKQQHTFTLNIIESTGIDPLQKGSKILRKGRNIYKECYLISSGKEREKELESKHSRGEKARAERKIRKNE